MAVDKAVQVYKNEDVNNPEYATAEEIQRAFFGRGVFIKNSDSAKKKVVYFDPIKSKISTISGPYKFAKPK